MFQGPLPGGGGSGGWGDVQEAAGWGMELVGAVTTSSKKKKLCLFFSFFDHVNLSEGTWSERLAGLVRRGAVRTDTGRRSGRQPSFRPDTSFVPTTTKQLLPLRSQAPSLGWSSHCLYILYSRSECRHETSFFYPLPPSPTTQPSAPYSL